jgi:hemerythrin-like metal-binding protein
MQLIEWDERLSVGISAIDDQHRKLIGMINSLHQAQRLGREQDVLEGGLDAVVDYTRRHFAFEEELIASAGYPHLAEHRVLHGNFLAHMEQFRERGRQASRAGLTLESMTFLREWLLDHIEGVDQRYAPYVSLAQRS